MEAFLHILYLLGTNYQQEIRMRCGGTMVKKRWIFVILVVMFLWGGVTGEEPFKTDAANAGQKSGGFSQNDLQLLAQTVYGEARGEPYIGQVAIAAVVLNRLEDERFPDTVSGVIYQPGAFTCVADGQLYLTPDETAKKAVRDAINGWDPSHGSVYYFNPDTATSKWIWSRPQKLKIGKHIFCE